MSKKISGVFFFVVLLLSLTACGESAANQWQEQYDLGEKYLLEEDYEAAIVAFTVAIEIEPNDIRTYTGLVQAYMGLEDYDSAIAAVEEGLAVLNSSDQAQAEGAEQAFLSAGANAYIVRAENYQDTEEPQKALDDYKAALELIEQGAESSLSEEELNELNEGNELVVWDDAVFEELVREKLSLEGDVYVRDLDEVTSLVILGNTHVIVNGDLDNWGIRYLSMVDQDGVAIQGDVGILTAFYGIGEGDEAERYTEKGDIHSVNALKYFRNLKRVQIIANHIEDISVISELDLTYADFFANDISDLSPLYSFENYDYNLNEQFVEIGDMLASDY